jgi:hypothetical protein
MIPMFIRQNPSAFDFMNIIFDTHVKRARMHTQTQAGRQIDTANTTNTPLTPLIRQTRQTLLLLLLLCEFSGATRKGGNATVHVRIHTSSRLMSLHEKMEGCMRCKSRLQADERFIANLRAWSLRVVSRAFTTICIVASKTQVYT